MTIHTRIVAFLIALLALRKPRDYVVKPVGFLAVIATVAQIAEYAVHGQLVLAPLGRIQMSVLTSTPFLLLVFYVVTYLDRVQLQLGQMAATDGLTGLSNRRNFMERATRSLARNDRSPRGVVLLIDADHFKRINDNWGHAVGDMCLRAIADLMRKELRAGDHLGRIGGEEFAAFLPMTDLVTGARIGSRLTHPITITPGKPAGRLTFTLSVGAAEVQEEMAMDTALHHADMALYRAKSDGRGRLVAWDGQTMPGKDRAA